MIISKPTDFLFPVTETQTEIVIDLGYEVNLEKRSGALTKLGPYRINGPFKVKRKDRWLEPRDFTLISYSWDSVEGSLKLNYEEDLSLKLFFEKGKITGRLSGIADTYRFPCLWGLKVDNDELITTNNFGELIPSPIQTLKLPVKVATCTWHNYKVARPVEGVPGCLREKDKATYRLGYCGLASMPWLFYGNKSEGFYTASYDERFFTTYLHMEATDTMLIGLEKIGDGEFDSKLAEFSYLKADWHEAARRYRDWALTWYKIGPVPDWVWDENGVLVHYDFKFQSGEIRHYFSDIPELYKIAKEANFKHLYVSAWNEGGFDTLYPQFFPDLELGTIRDLKKAIDTVKEDGGKISFYINTRIFNHRSEFYQSLGKKWAALADDGKEYVERYGKETFSCMCLAEPEWTKILKDFILWLVEDMGATGMYIDQVGAFPRLCYNEDHSHQRPDQWSLGYVKLLKDINTESKKDPFWIMEGCGDIYSQYVGAQLVHASWGLYTPYGHPEIYKYTFPEIIHVDMVHPKPVAVDVDALGLSPKEVSARMFLLGTHFWVYCHVLEDPELWSFIQQVLEVRDQIKGNLRRMRFVDNEGLKVNWAKRYTSLDEEMILFYNPDDEKEIKTTLSIPDTVEAIYLGEKPQKMAVKNQKLPTKGRYLGVFRWQKN